MDILGISLTDWVGYAAMFALLVSFIMKDVKNLRIINSVGCGLFVVYGFMLSTSWPIVITNSAIICINFYYLFIKK
ncbi:uroporphyrinogen decarboxylase [Flavobacteriaceae bacterium S0825]|uniref:uroporphyrinogen decarboxylase n=1 Tax=Gaetbulibacter sp. S0825 TaxID=2720084 RepID=UPI00143106BC|nr:uroporphyrinogen decarboxylase [Gaetbulibacter sp. S0825]MCK0110292.1 uroporphyrinogen decarboxylase [Flavobacteriaceae bacterium S0825]MCK0177939.1 uroporphyrinogen decarboxylase [Flavobacteriaceae bacterium S0862]NIX65921.1 uroporphyrinogen decarboxylase [Gaetbulibacter sp. S0825]